MIKYLLATGSLMMALSGMEAAAEAIPFDDERWDISAQDHKLVEYMGQRSLYLDRGRAYLSDAGFLNGIIEYDIAVTGARSFDGVRWRIQDDGNFEQFYLRPIQSGRADSNQYTPNFNGLSGWQLYFGPQFSAPTIYPIDEWFHIKIVVSGQRADIYVNSDQPVLHIPNLKRQAMAGMVGVTAAAAPVHYANFSVTEIDHPEIVGTPPEPEVRIENAIPAWSVSTVIEEASLEGKLTLSEEDLAGLSWDTLEIEGRGYANLSRLRARIPQTPTALIAALSVTAETAGIKKISFGYSDRVRVYLNGKLLYAGDNSYQSRDFRYLGTIGLFDELYLPLEAGANSLKFVVAESFGGWGIMAAFDDPTGLIIEP